MFRSSLIGINNVRYNSSTPQTPPPSSEIISQLPSFEETVQNLTTIGSDTIGYLESVGLPGNWFLGIFEHSLEYLHVYTGIPWWLTIVIATALFRIGLFPLSVKASENMTRNAKAKPELDAVKEQLNDASLSLRDKQLLQKELFAVMKKHGIKHRYALAPILQMATSIGLFMSIREMCLLPVEGFSTQGLSWITDLSASDPYAALPIVSALIYSLSIRRGGELGENSMPPAFKKIMFFMPIASIPFTMQLSAGVSLYLLTSAVFSALQMMLFSNKTTRKALGLSPVYRPPPGLKAKDESIKDSMTGFVEKMRDNANAKAQQFELTNKAHEIAKLSRQGPANAYIRPRKLSKKN